MADALRARFDWASARVECSEIAYGLSGLFYWLLATPCDPAKVGTEGSHLLSVPILRQSILSSLVAIELFPLWLLSYFNSAVPLASSRLDTVEDHDWEQ